MSIETRVAALRATLDKARENAPLATPSTTLLAAAKGQPTPSILEAIASGVRVFGENRVQEAYEKWPGLKKSHPNIELHLIGPLQTNKVKEALALFDVIQTLDRPKLAETLAGEIQKSRSRKVEKTLNFSASGLLNFSTSFYIQINTGEEPRKAGIFPKEADSFIRYCIDELKLPVVGLMCVPPADQPPAPHFALLRKIAMNHGLKELSMGMSGDYETAVRMGSTCVRIGTALFGKRI